eukprot:m.179904 g.179904  ORF g.179904 m.179904 type:complete len:1428 (-) comp14651_c1_seq1:201-4484(-)
MRFVCVLGLFLALSVHVTSGTDALQTNRQRNGNVTADLEFVCDAITAGGTASLDLLSACHRVAAHIQEANLLNDQVNGQDAGSSTHMLLHAQPRVHSRSDTTASSKTPPPPPHDTVQRAQAISTTRRPFEDPVLVQNAIQAVIGKGGKGGLSLKQRFGTRSTADMSAAPSSSSSSSSSLLEDALDHLEAKHNSYRQQSRKNGARVTRSSMRNHVDMQHRRAVEDVVEATEFAAILPPSTLQCSIPGCRWSAFGVKWPASSSDMLAFVNYTRFTVDWPDVPVYGIECEADAVTNNASLGGCDALLKAVDALELRLAVQVNHPTAKPAATAASLASPRTTVTRLMEHLAAAVYSLNLNGAPNLLDIRAALNTNALDALRALTIHPKELPRLDQDTFQLCPHLRLLVIRGPEGITNVRSMHEDAFLPLASLELLDLHVIVPAPAPNKLFSSFTSLLALNLDRCYMQDLPARMLAPMTQLLALTLSSNFLSESVFAQLAHLNHLQYLDLQLNVIASIPSNSLNALPDLAALLLETNKLTSLHPNTLQHATKLHTLDLSSNMLSALPASLLDTCTNLVDLSLEDNPLSPLPSTFLSTQHNLLHLNLRGCQLDTLPLPLLRSCTQLRALQISENRLTEVEETFLSTNTNLRSLDLGRNPLKALPRHFFRSQTRLERLVLLRTEISQLYAEHFLPFARTLSVLFLPRMQVTEFPNVEFPNLVWFDCSHNNVSFIPRGYLSASMVATDLGALTLAQPFPLAQLHHMHQLRSVVFYDTELDSSGFDPSKLELLAFFAGWPGMNTVTMPPDVMCQMLNTTAGPSLYILSSSYETLTMPCPLAQMAVFGGALTTLDMTASPVLSVLDVSGAPNLETLNLMGTVPFLDISNTMLPMSPQLCITAGSHFLVARNMQGKSWRSLPITPALWTHFLQQCVITSGMSAIDVSNNEMLNRPDVLQRALGSPFILRRDSRDIDLVPFLDTELPLIAPTLTMLTMTQVAVQCIPAFDSQLHLQQGVSFLHTTVIQVSTLMFECDCSVGYHLDSKSKQCVRTLLPMERPGIVALVVITCLSAGFLVQFAVRYLRTRYRRLHRDIDLHKHLLQNAEQELVALKQAWELDPDELAFLKRIDGTSPGAFGEVWQCRWDTILVAVKVLKQSIMAMDEATIDEFEREVEFLQRTRHMNVVRFFGAGRMHDGAPFLVLELVDRGSLTDFLKQDFETYPDAVQLSLSPFKLKLQLARGVANGMAFLHQRGQLHRDLKSGNVLVSSQLQAKISDFGTIRQTLTRSRRPGSVASHGIEDAPYGNAGSHTLVMTAGVGTPLYMAPEVLCGGRATFQSDVFSFGVLLFEIATQTIPDLLEQELGDAALNLPLMTTLLSLIRDGKRLEFPAEYNETATGRFYVPKWYVTLYRQLVADEPQSRGTFSEIVARFDEVTDTT